MHLLLINFLCSKTICDKTLLSAVKNSNGVARKDNRKFSLLKGVKMGSNRAWIFLLGRFSQRLSFRVEAILKEVVQYSRGSRERRRRCARGHITLYYPACEAAPELIQPQSAVCAHLLAIFHIAPSASVGAR